MLEKPSCLTMMKVLKLVVEAKSSSLRPKVEDGEENWPSKRPAVLNC